MSAIPREAARGRATTTRPRAQPSSRCAPTASRGRAPGAEPNRRLRSDRTGQDLVGRDRGLGLSPAVFVAGPGPGSRRDGAKSSLGPAFDDSELPGPRSRSGDSWEQLAGPISSFLQVHPQLSPPLRKHDLRTGRRKWDMVFAVKAPGLGEQTPALRQCRAPGSCVEHSASQPFPFSLVTT
ncbi:hypothetical protein AAY473_022390 [Plecturocebus cupreus]